MKIFVDLDGVLVDFQAWALGTHDRYHLMNDPSFQKQYWLDQELGMTQDEFWAPITACGPEWWSSMPDTPWAGDLVDAVSAWDADWEMASHPWNADSASGKWEWALKRYPDRNLHLSVDKCSLAAPGRLLIDDHEDHVNKWRDAGGEAILFPASYNSNRHWIRNRVQYVKDVLLLQLGYKCATR